MAESVSYWICSCGKSNLKGKKNCSSCNKKRPKKWMFYAGGILAFIIILGLLPQSEDIADEAQDNLPASQQSLISLLKKAQTDTSASANTLAVSEIHRARDQKLFSINEIDGWYGTVLGVQKMQGKGGVSIDIGGAKLLAGVHLSYGIDTLIAKSNTKIYQHLLLLKSGDAVVVSGNFATYNSSIVEMSYSSSNAISYPEFLFEFSSIVKR